MEETEITGHIDPKGLTLHLLDYGLHPIFGKGDGIASVLVGVLKDQDVEKEEKFDSA